MIGPERIKIEENKVKSVLDWLTSKCVKDVQKFLELANYYHQFIKDFAFIARLLHNMVTKNQKWECTERQEKVFKELKERFTKELVLKGTKYKFKVWTDYKNLEYFMKAQKLNHRQVHWVLYMSRFDFILKHVLGTKMGKADGLSR